MGTNYYRRGKLTKEQKNRFKEAIDKNDYKTVEELFNEYKEVHIGKSSYGWKFLWDANFFNYFEPNKESIYKWLKEGEIVDEYGEPYTYEEFINYIENRKKQPQNQHDASTYERYCTDEGIAKSHYPRDTRFFTWFTNRYGIDIDLYGEFYIDDMRFTVDSNFS